MAEITKALGNDKEVGMVENCRRWAKGELAWLDCGDRRRNLRLEQLLRDVAERPGQSLPSQCEQAGALKAAYRLLGSESVQAGEIVKSAARATVDRLQKRPVEGVLLAVQDTTTLNFTTHAALVGRGPIGNNEKTQGFHAHTTLLLGEDELVHGVVNCEVYAREAGAQRARQAGERNRQSAMQKESHRWIRSLQHTAVLCEQLPQAQALISIADREADMYELFVEALRLQGEQAGRFHVLVRAQHDRQLEDEQNRLWDHLAEQPACVCWSLELPAPKGLHSRQVRHVEALWQSVTLAVPAHQKKHHGHEQPITLTAIIVREPMPPPGQSALEWVLLTTWPVNCASEAQRVVRWYARRWQIEVLHRVWKTGCAVEHRRLQDPRAAKVMIVVDLLTAVRLMTLNSAARFAPNASADGWLDPEEQEVLRAKFESPKTGTAGRPLTIGQALRWISQLGGHRGAPSSPPPGPDSLWRGLLRLQDLTHGWILMSKASKKCG